MSGASGPSTSPRPIVATAASTTPGSMFGSVVPIWRPFAGMWPPPPGRRTMAKATGNPARKSTGSGHHHGTLLNPRSPGRSLNTPIWIWLISSRNPHDASDTTTPTTAANTRITTKLLVRSNANGSGASRRIRWSGRSRAGVSQVGSPPSQTEDAPGAPSWDHDRRAAACEHPTGNCQTHRVSSSPSP